MIDHQEIAALSSKRDAALQDAVALRGIDKNFGGVRALRGVDLYVRRGEIMGLCGENGAGKSTLIKVLAGVHSHDSYRGSVTVNGQPQRFTCPADSQLAGIAVVHQELMLVPELSVSQNLLLGREPRRFGLLDDEELEAVARAELDRFGFAEQIDPSRTIAELGIGLQQIVEILRALSQKASILILDEPTAALTSQEALELLRWLKKLKGEGTTCIYVSHRIDEVFAICDRVTVLRDGQHVATVETAHSNPDEVVSLMVGRSVVSGRPKLSAPRQSTNSVLEVRNFGVRLKGNPGRAQSRRLAVQDVSFAVASGEIVAICGAMGSGRTALLSSLFGCSEAGTVGSVLLDGQPVNITSPACAIAFGLAFVPEDRRGRGLVVGMTVAENLALPSLTSRELMGPAVRVGLVDPHGEARLAERRIQGLGIRGQAAAAVATLSGGNQQKVVLGKWLEHPPKVLIMDEPTRGVDVGAREEIYAILERLAEQGIGVLFASSDLQEVLRLAHRIIVLRQGRIAGEFPGSEASEQRIAELSTGARGDGRSPQLEAIGP